ncbi:MAG: hypothetical protein ACRD9R_04165 [Pyrinomonadaceae bacterium]
MRQGFLALFILLAISPMARAQDAGSPEARRFSISSLNSAFGVQGDFEGEYRVYPGRIELKLTKANIHVSEHCPYKGRRLLSALKFGLAKSIDAEQWDIADAGPDLLLGQVSSPGDVYRVGEFYFHIPRDDSADLSKRWLVAQIEDTALDVPEAKRRKGYAFAHSCRDIFTPTK